MGETPLILAIQNGHLEVVKLLIGKGVPINDLGGKPNHHTPLQEAFLFDMEDIVEWLIKAGADTKARGCCAATYRPLHEAVEHGWVGVVECLAPKVNTNAKTQAGATALLVAALAGRQEIVDILLKNKADPNIADKKGRYALYLAANNGLEKVVELLVKKGAKVNIVGGDQKKTPLLCAAAANNIPIAVLLLQHGADVNAQNLTGQTPLHIASGKGCHEMVKLLLKYGADTDIGDKEKGSTPLYIAVKSKFGSVVETLLEYGADVNASNKDGVLPVHVAAHALNEAMMEVLLSHGAYYNVDAKALNSRSTPLKLAVKAKNTKIITMLELIKNLLSAVAEKDVYQIECCILAGAIMNARNADGMTALHRAVHSRHMNTINLLLKHSADIEFANNKGNPLHTAVVQGKEELIATLLAHVKKFSYHKRNRIINATTNEGATALHIAAEKNNFKVVQLLLKNGATYNIKNKSNATPFCLSKSKQVRNIFKSAESLFEVVRNDQDSMEEVAKLLADHGSVINARDSDGGGTLLYWSALKGHVDITEFLLKQGADYSLVTNRGTGPLHIAASKGHTKIVRAIVKQAISDNSAEAPDLVSTITVSGTAPLHVASNKEIVSCLLQTGAIFGVQNRDAKTPWALSKNEDIRKLIQTTQELFKGMIKCPDEIMSTLSSLDPDDFKAVIGARNEAGQTLRQVAQANGHVETANKLKEKTKTAFTSSAKDNNC